jgi:hypothetical protein
MKVKQLAVTVAVCAALMVAQDVIAEERSITAERMDYAFNDAQDSSVRISELSNVEMDETEGASSWGAPDSGYWCGWCDFYVQEQIEIEQLREVLNQR